MNVAFGVDTTRLSGRGVVGTRESEHQDCLEDFSPEELEEDVKLAADQMKERQPVTHVSLKGLELSEVSDINPNIP